MNELTAIQQELKAYSNPQKAEDLSRFFKTGKGQYGEGDRFLGIIVPQQRIVAKKHKAAALTVIHTLLKSPIHEHRLTALFILVDQFRKADNNRKKEIFDVYLSHTKNINNWDLVDLSAPTIVGEYVLTQDEKILTSLARSNNLWERRIATLATFAFIRQNRYSVPLTVAALLIFDPHDLIHKAVGWMLREIGKRDMKTEEEFLQKYYQTMPRTMLRYAIEKFPEEKRKKYLFSLLTIA